MGALKGLLLMLAGGGSEAGFLDFSPSGKDFMETARQYLSQEVFTEQNGKSFVIEDAFGRGPFAGGKAECFARINGDIWQVKLEKPRLGGWRVIESQKLDAPETWICNLLERNDTNEKTNDADNDVDLDVDHDGL